MTDQEVVKQKWPDACIMHAGIHDRWNIYTSPPFAPGAGFIIGYAIDRHDAWADAARRIQEPGA